MTNNEINAFNRLLDAWNHRQQLRLQGADIGAMVEARRDLDRARLEMSRTRAH